MAYERSWNSSIYRVTDSQGTNGAVVFGENRRQFVAAFFAEQSTRSPFLRGGAGGDAGARLLERIPLALKPLALALPSLTFDDRGAAVRLVTSIFWSGLPDEHAASCESWEDVFENGASLIENELLGEQAALAAWAADMALGNAEMALVAAVYRRRLASAPEEVMLTHAETEQLSRLSRDEQGIRACKTAFSGIGICFPVD